jgi:hypothetical protein
LQDLKFTISLNNLKNLVSEVYLYDSENIFKKTISCENSCIERTKLTRCSCDSLCENYGDCCYDYWHYCKQTVSGSNGKKSKKVKKVPDPYISGVMLDDVILDEKKLNGLVDQISKTKALYSTCGILSLPNNEDVNIKLISQCSDESIQEQEAAGLFTFKQDDSSPDEFKYLTFDMTHLSRYSKFRTIYEKLCVSNELYIETYEQASKLLYMAFDVKTNLFYKNYFCARCNNIKSKNIKVIEPKIKCPLEYDIQLKKGKRDFEADFYTLKYESPCIFTYKNPTQKFDEDEENEEIVKNKINIQYRHCYQKEDNLFRAKISHDSNLDSFLELAANKTLNRTIFKVENNDRLKEIYSNLCDLFILPIKVNITQRQPSIISNQASFRNLFCLKSWLLARKISTENLNETQFIKNLNETWTYETEDYKIEISSDNIFASKDHSDNQKDFNKFSGEDFRQAHHAYNQLSSILNGDYKKFEDNNDSLFVTTPLKRTAHVSAKTVQNINLTNINSNTPLIQLIQYERRRSIFQQHIYSHNFTIKITLHHSINVDQINQESFKNVNLNDLNDEERLYLFKQIISDVYVDKLIERYKLQSLLVSNDYQITIAYLPSKSRDDYRFNVNIYLLVKINEINLNNLNERLKALMRLINNFFHRDLVFFKLYKDTVVRKIEFLNYFVNKKGGIDDIDDQFHCIHDPNHVTFHSINEIQFDYDQFIENHLVAIISDDPDGKSSKIGVFNQYLFLLTRFHAFGLNESNFQNEAKYHRYSVIFDKNSFKLQNKIQIRFCHLKQFRESLLISSVASSVNFECPAVTHDLHLIKNLNENIQVKLLATHSLLIDTITNSSIKFDHKNIHVFRTDDILPSVLLNNSEITIQNGHLLVCTDKTNDVFNDIVKFNQQYVKYNMFWFDSNDLDIIDEIIDNFWDQLNNWENIFWAIFSFIVIFLLSYMHIKF